MLQKECLRCGNTINLDVLWRALHIIGKFRFFL